MITVARSKRVWKEGWVLLPKDLFVIMLKNQIKLGINGGIGISGMIESAMADWCDENWNRTPAESVIREKISPIYNHIRKAGK